VTFYDNKGTNPDEAINVVDGKVFNVVQIADSNGNLVDPATNEIVVTGDLYVNSEVKVNNTTLEPVPVNVLSAAPINLSGGIADAFGRMRVSEPFTLGDYKHLYGIDSNFTDYLINGGSVQHLPNQACARLSVTTSTGSRVVHQTKLYHHYMPGKSQLVKSTFNFWGVDTGIRKRTGYFDDNNGIFFEMTGTGELAFNIRTYVSGSVDDVTNRVVQSSWNKDTCDGNGPSGFNLLKNKTHIFFTDFQWLGVGRVRCGFVHNGEFIVAHEYYNDNVKDTVYMSNPNLPIRCEIENTGGGGNSYMDQICSTVVSEGGYVESGTDWAVISPSLRTLTANATLPVLAIRLKSSYKTYANRMIARLSHVAVFSSSENIKYQVVKLNNAAALTTASAWVLVDDDSGVEYNSGATAYSGGDVIDAGWAPASSQNVNKPFANVSPGSPPSAAKKNFIVQNYGSTDSEIYAVVATNLTASNTSVGVALQWREIF